MRQNVYPESCVKQGPFDLWRDTTAPPPPPKAKFCADADCCKEQAKYDEDKKLCDDFYDTGVGIALTMLSKEAWSGSCYGKDDTTCAVFSEEPPMSMTPEIGASTQQAMSITHFKKSARLPGDQLKSGMAFHISEDVNFWEYFQLCGLVNNLNAQCVSGPKCPDGKVMFNDEGERGLTYNEFKDMKNQIVSQTGTDECPEKRFVSGTADPHDYNEFEATSLSPSALAGVIHDPSIPMAAREDKEVCQTMKAAQIKRRTPWPVYAYQVAENGAGSSLKVERYIKCHWDVVGPIMA